MMVVITPCVQDSICEDKTHAEHASPSLHPAPDLSCQYSGGRNSCSSFISAFVCFLHHGNCPESQRNFHRHLLYANSCQINHCILQHNPWGGLYLWNLLLSLHFPIYLNHVIHSARRMNVTAWDFNPSLLRIWFSEREQKSEQEIQRKKLKVRVKYHYFSALGLGKGCIIKVSS